MIIVAFLGIPSFFVSGILANTDTNTTSCMINYSEFGGSMASESRMRIAHLRGTRSSISFCWWVVVKLICQIVLIIDAVFLCPVERVGRNTALPEDESIRGQPQRFERRSWLRKADFETYSSEIAPRRI
jgi:hypothetical protein